jgi:hypothetical protein
MTVCINSGTEAPPVNILSLTRMRSTPYTRHLHGQNIGDMLHMQYAVTAADSVKPMMAFFGIFHGTSYSYYSAPT